jgi:hypothetical protein
LPQRPDLELKPLAVLFAAFIFLCGLTHLMQMVTPWWPIYETQGVLKAVTAFVSLATALMIYPLIPRAVAIPSPRTLQAANEELKREIDAHADTLQRLRETRDTSSGTSRSHARARALEGAARGPDHGVGADRVDDRGRRQRR